MPPAIGPAPRFAEAHVRMALELIAKRERIGRKQLAKELGVGEGSMRTILNQLKRENLITSSRGGHALTAKGRRLLGKAPKFIQIDVGDLAVGRVSVATLVKKAGKKIKRGVEQRDAAIKAGADGATVLVFRRGKFQFPDGFLDVGKAINDSLVEVFGPSEGDVLIIGSASDPIKAERGARAAAESLD